MSEEKREYLRLPIEGRIFIELLSPRMGSTDTGRIVTCTTLNVSRRGLKVSIDEELTVGAILQIGVQMPDADEPLHLAGEVEWCMAGEGDYWFAGFRLIDANNSDIDSWVSLLTEMDG